MYTPFSLFTYSIIEIKKLTVILFLPDDIFSFIEGLRPHI